MYHIKNDRRCIKSAEAIVEALSTLLEKKDYENITISDIQRESSVGRATFYRLFDTIDDVVAYKIDDMLQEFASSYREQPLRGFITGFIETVLNKGDKMLNVAVSGRIDLIVSSMKKSLISIMDNSLITSDDSYEYKFAVFCGATISLIASWRTRGQQESIEELINVLEQYLNIDNLILL